MSYTWTLSYSALPLASEGHQFLLHSSRKSPHSFTIVVLDKIHTYQPTHRVTYYHMVIYSEGATLLMLKYTNGHDHEPVKFSSYPHSTFPQGKF